LVRSPEEAVEGVVRWAAQSTARASPWNPITHEGVDEFLGWRAAPTGNAFGRVNAALEKTPAEE
jgi:hypothetical protein